MTENFWDKAAAAMSQDDLDQCMIEWEACRAGGDLCSGLLTETCARVLRQHGMSVSMLGRVEAAKEMVFACMRRSYFELKAMREVNLETPRPKP